MHPIQLLLGGLFNLFSITLIVLDVVLFKEWYSHREMAYSNYSERCLAFAVIVLVFIVLGKFIVGIFLGKKADGKPLLDRTSDFISLKRPDGHTLHVEQYGTKNARAVIFLHGWSSSLAQWYYFRQALSADYHLLLVDLPGLGKSTKPENNDYSLEKFARDLDAVISLCEDKKPVVIGHSIGGMTILTACKTLGAGFYRKVSGLVLIHTTYRDPAHTSIFSGLLTALEKPLLAPFLRVMIALAPAFQLMNWMKYLNGSMHMSNAISGFAGTQTRNQLNLTAYLSTVAPIDVVARGCLSMFAYDALEVLPSIPLPVLVITGKNDLLTRSVAGAYIGSQIKNSRLAALDSCAHMGVLERNKEEVTLVTNFINEVSSKS